MNYCYIMYALILLMKSKTSLIPTKNSIMVNQFKEFFCLK
nr:MAG TPA: hypothetical protein [Caudoviricetes sp.]